MKKYVKNNRRSIILFIYIYIAFNKTLNIYKIHIRFNITAFISKI